MTLVLLWQPPILTLCSPHVPNHLQLILCGQNSSDTTGSKCTDYVTWLSPYNTLIYGKIAIFSKLTSNGHCNAKLTYNSTVKNKFVDVNNGKKMWDDHEGTINHLVHHRPFLGFKAVVPNYFVIPTLSTKTFCKVWSHFWLSHWDTATSTAPTGPRDGVKYLQCTGHTEDDLDQNVSDTKEEKSWSKVPKIVLLGIQLTKNFC